MKPIKFKEANKTLLKPHGMSEEECTSLYIYTNGRSCISLWKVSWLERIQILFTGKIWFQILSGQSHAPIKLDVKYPFERGN